MEETKYPFVSNGLIAYLEKTLPKDELYSCTDHKYTYGEPEAFAHSIEEGLRLLQEAEEISGHNIVKFDIPTLQKLYPSFNP